MSISKFRPTAAEVAEIEEMFGPAAVPAVLGLMAERMATNRADDDSKRGKMKIAIIKRIGSAGATGPQIRAAVKDAGFNPKGVPAATKRLIDDGMVVKEDGKYRLTEQKNGGQS